MNLFRHSYRTTLLDGASINSIKLEILAKYVNDDWGIRGF